MAKNNLEVVWNSLDEKLPKLTDTNDTIETVNSETKEKLSDYKKDLLTPWLPEGAFDIVKDKLQIQEPINISAVKKSIQDYQKKQGLSVDIKNPMVWMETFTEMKSEIVNIQIDKSIEVWNLNNILKQDILSLVEKPGKWKSYLLFSLKLDLIKSKFWKTEKEFILAIEKKVKIWAKNLQKDPKAAKAWKDLWDNINAVVNWKMGAKEFFEKSKWAMMVVGLIGFIFFGDKTWIPWTWSIWSRLAILIWGSALWLHKVVWNLATKAIDWIWWVAETAVETFEERKVFVNNMEKPKWISKMSKNVSGWIDSIKWSYTNIVWWLLEKNTLNKKSNKEKYITDFKLISETINNDDNFVNKEASFIDDNKNDVNSLRWVLSAESQSKLFPDSLTWEKLKQRNKDLINYTKLLLEKKWDKVFVKDILVDTSLINKFKNKSLEANVWYIDNNKLDDEIKILISEIPDSELKTNFLTSIFNIVKIEEWNSKDNYNKIDKFILDNKNNLSETFLTNIKVVQKIFLSEVILGNSIEDISKVELKPKEIEATTLSTIQDKLNKIDTIKADLLNNSSRLKITDNSLFEKAYNTKRLELVKKWAELEWKAPWIYTSELSWLKEKVKKDELSSKIEKLSKGIWELPKESSKPFEFKKYINDNISRFKELQKLKKSPKAGEVLTQIDINLNNKIIVALRDYTVFKENYEKSKAIYNGKINTIISKINILDSSTKGNIDENEVKLTRKILDERLVEFSKLEWEIISWITVVWVVKTVEDLYKNYIKSEYIPIESNNIFTYIDNKIESKKITIESISIIPALLKQVVSKLENKFDTKLNIKIDDVTSVINVGAFVSKVNKVEKQIKSLDAEPIKKLKLKELGAEVQKNQVQFVINIQKSKTEVELEESYTFYEDNFKDKINSDLLNSNVNKAYNSWLDKFKKELDKKNEKELLSRAVWEQEINVLIENAWFFEFIEKIKKIDKNLFKQVDWIPDSTSLLKVISYFKWFTKSNYSNEIKSLAEDVYKDLIFEKNKELKWYFEAMKIKILD